MTGGAATPPLLANGTIRMSLDLLHDLSRRELARSSHRCVRVNPLRRTIKVSLALGVLLVAALPASPSSRVAPAARSEKVAVIERPARHGVHRAPVGSGCASCHAREMSVSDVACREPSPLFRMMLID